MNRNRDVSWFSKKKELVGKLQGRLGTQVLPRQVGQFVGVLAGSRNSDGAWEVPVQVAQDVCHPTETKTTVT